VMNWARLRRGAAIENALDVMRPAVMFRHVSSPCYAARAAKYSA
jgi:hypothetical protein